MFKSLRIEHFRSLKRLEVSKLQRLNLVTGQNAGGKTSLLEAVFLNSGGANAMLTFSVSVFRGNNTIHPESDRMFRSLFSDLDVKKPIQIVIDDDRIGKRRQRLLRIESITRHQQAPGQQGTQALVSGVRFFFRGPSGEVTSRLELKQPSAALNIGRQMPGLPVEPPISVDVPTQKDVIMSLFISPYLREVYQEIHDQLVQAVKSGAMSRIIEIVSLVEARVRNVIPLVEWGQPNIYVDIGGEGLLPLPVLGSGFFHLLRLALGIAQVQDGIIIIDELEDGIHYSIMPKVAKVVIQALENKNLQFFVSTHSSELIKAFIEEAHASSFTEMCLIKMSGHRGEVVSGQFDREEIDFALELNGELR